MSTNTIIAARTLVANDAAGREFKINLGVGQPYEISPHEWACAVRLDGLHDGLRDIHGADSWQAMQLAYQLIAQLLGYFIEDGGRLYWPGETDAVVLTELVPHLSTDEHA